MNDTQGKQLELQDEVQYYGPRGYVSRAFVVGFTAKRVRIQEKYSDRVRVVDPIFVVKVKQWPGN